MSEMREDVQGTEYNAKKRRWIPERLPGKGWLLMPVLLASPVVGGVIWALLTYGEKIQELVNAAAKVGVMR
ncbi:MAG: hypothetical protein IJ083_10455 [Clostridia bacterium]|nr:hypothetical protein [Clostridia bacterium]